MTTILDYVKGYIPETYRAMTEQGDLDTEHNADVVGQKLGVVMSRVFASGTTENDLDNFCKDYVAMMVVMQVIPAGIDYWMVKTRLQQSAPASVGDLGGENVQYYNRVQTLNDLSTSLRSRLIEARDEFERRVGTLLAGAESEAVSVIGPRVARSREDMRTLDPDSVAKMRTRRWRSSFGVLIGED